MVPSTRSICPLLLFPLMCTTLAYTMAGQLARVLSHGLHWEIQALYQLICRKSLGESAHQIFSVSDERLNVGVIEIDDFMAISWQGDKQEVVSSIMLPEN